MIKEAIDKLQQLSNAAISPELFQAFPNRPDGKVFAHENKTTAAGSRDLGAVLRDPEYPTLNVSTLTGLVDTLSALPEDFKVDAVHVADPFTVAAFGPLDYWNRRPVYVIAKHEPANAFQFDTYYQEPEKFIIGLQTAFAVTDEAVHLMKVVSALRAGSMVETTDNGFTQTLTVKTGEVTTADVAIEPRIKLAPIRTFSEVNPTMNEFLIRFKGGSGLPQPALFNAAGTKWKMETVQAIRKYLGDTLAAGTRIIA